MSYVSVFFGLDENRPSHDFDEKNDIISTTSSGFACGFAGSQQLNPLAEILVQPLNLFLTTLCVARFLCEQRTNLSLC